MENEDNKIKFIFFTLNGGRVMTTLQMCLSSLVWTTDSSCLLCRHCLSVSASASSGDLATPSIRRKSRQPRSQLSAALLIWKSQIGVLKAQLRSTEEGLTCLTRITLFSGCSVHYFSQGIIKRELSLYHWPPVWLVWNQLYDYWQFLFLFAKQTNPNQSNRRSMVQWYFPL